MQDPNPTLNSSGLLTTTLLCLSVAVCNVQGGSRFYPQGGSPEPEPVATTAAPFANSSAYARYGNSNYTRVHVPHTSTLHHRNVYLTQYQRHMQAIISLAGWKHPIKKYCVKKAAKIVKNLGKNTKTFLSGLYKNINAKKQQKITAEIVGSTLSSLKKVARADVSDLVPVIQLLLRTITYGVEGQKSCNKLERTTKQLFEKKTVKREDVAKELRAATTSDIKCVLSMIDDFSSTVGKVQLSFGNSSKKTTEMMLTTLVKTFHTMLSISYQTDSMYRGLYAISQVLQQGNQEKNTTQSANSLFYSTTIRPWRSTGRPWRSWSSSARPWRSYSSSTGRPWRSRSSPGRPWRSYSSSTGRPRRSWSSSGRPWRSYSSSTGRPWRSWSSPGRPWRSYSSSTGRPRRSWSSSGRPWRSYSSSTGRPWRSWSSSTMRPYSSAGQRCWCPPMSGQGSTTYRPGRLSSRRYSTTYRPRWTVRRQGRTSRSRTTTSSYRRRGTTPRNRRKGRTTKKSTYRRSNTRSNTRSRFRLRGSG